MGAVLDVSICSVAFREKKKAGFLVLAALFPISKISPQHKYSQFDEFLTNKAVTGRPDKANSRNTRLETTVWHHDMPCS